MQIIQNRNTFVLELIAVEEREKTMALRPRVYVDEFVVVSYGSVVLF